MSESFDRKAALQAYKERMIRPGIYAVRLRSTGQAWANSAPDLDAIKNGLWNRLNEGRHLDKGLQAAWNQHGASAFDYVILEVFKDEMKPLVLKETLKTRKAEWIRILAQDQEEGGHSERAPFP